ncbi:MAG TPA: hypothetical protein VFJ25_09190 [Casimicrobiaceae bacterium]|nr:hypothetical protein [Casimicrobiaceae bacterium]
MREGFGTREIEVSGERQKAAIVARVTAEIQARSIVAMQRPRDLMKVRERLLADASRPAFAAVALYRKPVGKQKNEETGKREQKYVEGPSIRFVEAAMRAYGNCVSDSMIVQDDARSRTVRVTVTDLETNTTHAGDVEFAKTIERRNVREGQTVIRARENSYGDKVYIVEATDDELLVKQAALVSKALRTQGIRIIPGDLVDEARAKCLETQNAETKRDPSAALKAIVDWFAKKGVRTEHLAQYLGHPVDACTAEEITELRAVANGIGDNEVTWKEALEAKLGEREEEAHPENDKKAEAASPAESGSKIDQLKAKLSQKDAAKKAATAQPGAAAQSAQQHPAAATAKPSPVQQSAPVKPAAAPAKQNEPRDDESPPPDDEADAAERYFRERGE